MEHRSDIAICHMNSVMLTTFSSEISHWNLIPIKRIFSSKERFALLPCTIHLTPARESEQKEHTEIGLLSFAACDMETTLYTYKAFKCQLRSSYMACQYNYALVRGLLRTTLTYVIGKRSKNTPAGENLKE